MVIYKLINTRVSPFICVIILQVIAITMANISSDIEQGAIYATRWSARAGFPIFLIAFTAGAYHTLFKNSISLSLMKFRRQWGLAFALSHAVHFIFILYYLRVNGLSISIENLGAGLIPYTFITIMALTSNNFSVRLLGRNWKRLHWIGAYSIWIGYTLSYYGRLFDDEAIIIGVIGSILCSAALLLRITAKYKISFKIK